MRAIYSYHRANDTPVPAAAGWRVPGYEFVVWAWSVVQTRRWASRVELVTDSAGAELFAALGIPFDAINVALDDLDTAGGELWSLAKIAAYERQTEPFVHLDGDAWFSQPPPPEFLAAPVGCQSAEPTDWQSPYPEHVARVVEQSPAGWPFDLWRAIGERPIVASCTAVLVANDLTLVREYCRTVRAFWAFWQDRLGSQDMTVWNWIVEQLALGELHFQTLGGPPVYLLAGDREQAAAVAPGVGFAHVWGAKVFHANQFQSVRGLRTHHPELFFRIADHFGMRQQMEREVEPLAA